MMQPPPLPAPQSALDPEEIARETGFPIEKVQADIQASGATTKEQLYPSFYGSSDGIDPQVAQSAPGMPPQVPLAAAASEPVDDNPRRAMAQRAMAGQPEAEPQSPNAMSPNDGDYAINRAAGMPPTEPSQPHAALSPDDDMRERSALGVMAQRRAAHVLPHKRRKMMPRQY